MTEYRHHCRLMGSAFELIVAADSEPQAQQWLQQGVAEIQRIEGILTEYDERSETSLINRQAGIEPVRVSDEVHQLLSRCIDLSTLTQGAFDITIGPLKKLYQFKRGNYTFPEPEVLLQAINRVGYKHIELLPDSRVLLHKTGMQLSFAAVGKGYAADKVKELWLKAGVKSGVVNASGDLTVIGTKYNGEAWQAGIADPNHADKVLLYVPLHDTAIATSGDYEQYFIRDGVRYSHTLHPLTGYPLSGVKSVSIISPSAALSDAIATAVYVMGVEVGMHLVEQLPAVQCIIIDSADKMYLSKHIKVAA